MATSGDFINKVAIVTGASSGIGQATAILLAKKGASVVLCGRDINRLKSSLDQCIEASGGNTNRFTFVVGDIKTADIRKAIVDKTVDTFQRLDILVANAGVVFQENNENISEDIFDEMFDTNVKAVFFLIQNALPHLKKSEGSIVNVSSIGSNVALRGRTVYPMTKAAVDHMTRCLALDLAPNGIRVNAVNPSYVPSTRIARNFGDDQEGIMQQMIKEEGRKQILYGKCVTPEATADTIAFLASDAAKFVTGQCHVVDGGCCFLGSQ